MAVFPPGVNFRAQTGRRKKARGKELPLALFSLGNLYSREFRSRTNNIGSRATRAAVEEAFKIANPRITA